MRLEVAGRRLEARRLAPGRLLVELDDSSLVRDAVKAVMGPPGLVYLEAITGVDRPEEGVVELYYLFWLASERSVLMLRVRVPRDRRRLPSVADIVPAAAPYEMEVYDLLGVVFEGNERLREGFLKPEELRGRYPLLRG